MMRTSDYTELAQRLSEFYTDAEATQWMRSPHPQLEGRRPVDCQFAEVAAIIARLEDGAYL